LGRRCAFFLKAGEPKGVTKRMTKETLMSPEFDKRISAALLILRFFLATFLLQWSIEKLILPDAAARIASNFYGVTLPGGDRTLWASPS